MLNILTALIGTAISTYTDIRTGFVPDWLSHLMILIGAALVPIYFPTQVLLIYALAVVVFCTGFIFYIFGQIGGGDVKLFTALILLIPFYPQTLAPVLSGAGINPVIPGYPFILSVFILSGILFMIFVPAAYLRKIRHAKKQIKDYQKKLRVGAAYSLLLIPLFAMWAYLAPALLVLAAPFVLTMLIIPFKDDMVKLFFAKKKKIADLNDDDVLALELLDKKTKKKLGLWRKTFTKFELRKIKERAKKARISEIFVCENLPKFVPFIFISLIVNLILGDFLLYLMLAA